MSALQFSRLSRVDRKLAVSVLITVYALILRFLCLAQRDLWGDEIYEFHCIYGPLRPFWQRITSFDFGEGYFLSGDFSSFPGEYLLNYPVVQIFGLNKWGLAVPHILLTVAGFYFLYRVCGQYLRTWAGYGIAFLMVALNTSIIFASFEFRPYGVLATFALGALYFTGDIVGRYEQMTRRDKILRGLFFVALMSYHAYGLLIAGLPVAHHLFLSRKEPLGNILRAPAFRYFAAVFAVGAPIWAWYASANAFGMQGMDIRIAKDVFEYIPGPAANPVGFLKGVFGNLAGHKAMYVFLPGLPLTFLIPHRDRIAQLIFLFWMIFLPIGLILFVDLKSSYWFVQRQFVWVMPLFAVFLAWSWETVTARFWAKHSS